MAPRNTPNRVLQGERNTSRRNGGLPTPRRRPPVQPGYGGAGAFDVNSDSFRALEDAKFRGDMAWADRGIPGADTTTPADQVTSGFPLATLPGFGGGGGGGGRGGGGGGGGAAGAQRKAAIEAALRAAYAETGGVYDSYNDELESLYQPDVVNARYDGALGGIKDSAIDANTRINKTYRELGARNKVASQNIDNVFAGNDQNLRNIGAGLQADYGARLGGVNSSMGAFGAGPVEDNGGALLGQLQGQGQVFNNNLRGNWGAAQADRQSINDQFVGDLKYGIQADRSGLERQIAASRAADLRGVDMARVEARQGSALDRLTSMNDIRMKLAELGITL